MSKDLNVKRRPSGVSEKSPYVFSCIYYLVSRHFGKDAPSPISRRCTCAPWVRLP